jgi:exonuclease-1
MRGCDTTNGISIHQGKMSMLQVETVHYLFSTKGSAGRNVSYVVAPYEADAQLAYMENIGLVDAILTEDSDLLVFGCKNVLYKLDVVDNTVISICRDKFGSVTSSSDPNSISLYGWSDTQFRAMAILSGCDYLPSIPGVGLKTANSLLRKWKTAEQVIRAIAMEGKKSVPFHYGKEFQLAEMCFLHQRVYCPLSKKLVHLKDPGADLNEETDTFVGRYVERSISTGISMF